MGAPRLRVRFVGGVYDGEVADVAAQCSGCGRPLGIAGAVLVDPIGEIWRLEPEGRRMVARHVGSADQLCLDDLLGR